MACQGLVTEDSSEGLHVAGWCNEGPHQGGGGDTEEKKGAGVSKKLELTLLLVNSGTGRRGGVRVVAPSSGRWLEATPSYARDIVSLPTSDEPLSSQLTIHRSGGDSLGVGPGRLQLIDRIPLPKYGASEQDYVPHRFDRSISRYINLQACAPVLAQEFDFMPSPSTTTCRRRQTLSKMAAAAMGGFGMRLRRVKKFGNRCRC